MSPWKEPRTPRWPVYAGIGCVATGIILGLLLMAGVFSGDGTSGHPDDRSTSEPTEPTAAGTEPPDAAAADGPEVVSWGQQGRQLAVMVRNDSDQTIRQARVRITGTNAAGQKIISTVGTPNNVCCTIFGLPPGEEFGVYAPIRPSLGKVADVTVAYESPVVAPADTDAGTVTVGAGRLHRSADNTVVTATLTAEGPVGAYVAAQAFLVDADGDLAQVISGRYWCYEPGTERRVRLELFRAVPDDLRLDKVVAHSIPDGVPAGVDGRC